MSELRKMIKRVPGAYRLAKLIGVADKVNHARRFLLEKLPKHSRGAEIGVHLGDFSAEILRVVRPVELHLIDPWEHQKSDEYKNAWYGGQVRDGQREMDRRFQSVKSRFSKEIEDGVVKVHRGYSDEMLGAFEDSYFDWIYIDGNHLYEFVQKDLDIGFSKVRSGGLVTGDDYVDTGWWMDGVKRAVDEFSNKYPGALLPIRNKQFLFVRP